MAVNNSGRDLTMGRMGNYYSRIRLDDLAIYDRALSSDEIWRLYNEGCTPEAVQEDVAYRFGFNGKENDNEVHGATGTFQDYGARGYDTRLGRFPSVDPIAAQYPWLSPYQFAGNSPIRCTDLDGMEPKSVVEKWNPTSGHTYDDGMVIQKVEGWWVYQHVVSASPALDTYYYYDDSGCDPAWKTFTPLTQAAADQANIDATVRSLDRMQKGLLGAAFIGALAVGTVEVFGYEAVSTFVSEEVREEVVEQVTGVPGINDIKDVMEFASKRAFKETAREGSLAFFETTFKGKRVEFGGEMTNVDGLLTIKGFDVEGASPGDIGIGGIRELMTDFGKEMGVGKVVVEGAKRTTGANPGRLPSTLEFIIE